MNWKVVAVGKPSLSWAYDGVSDYLSRINKTCKIEIVYLRHESRERTERAMLAAADKCLAIALDERGKQMRSTGLAGWIKDRELSGNKRVCIFLGGSDGLSERLRSSVNESWSLSSFTFQHELALVVVLEQIYRAYSIIRGEPYHRE